MKKIKTLIQLEELINYFDSIIEFCKEEDSDFYSTYDYEIKWNYIRYDFMEKISIMEKLNSKSKTYFIENLQMKRDSAFNCWMNFIDLMAEIKVADIEYQKKGGSIQLLVYERIMKYADDFNLIQAYITSMLDLLEVKGYEMMENKYPHIFVEAKHYNLFDHWRLNITESNDQLVKYSIIYRLMIKDKFIFEHVTPKVYMDWLSVNYNISLEQIKSESTVSKDKIIIYKTLKQLYRC